jgi:hypothetical protein
MNLGNRSRSVRRITTLVGVATLITGFGAAVATSPVRASVSSTARTVTEATSGCQLGNGVKHVVQITFDNVHFFQDNPSVPSDLQLMPNLLNFFENNGTFLSNNHTPLIAHTADDILTTYTGLYGDRQGMPVSNAYEVYQTNGTGGTFGTTDNASSFAYWTDPIFDTSPTATDTNPSMVYSPVPPATAKNPVSPTTTTPAPWVPYTRAGCDVGNVATPADSELENTAVDIPKVFGVGSPEDEQLINDTDKFKDQEAADYTGLAVHCAKGSTFCADATGVKYPGTGGPASTAAADLLPDEPGGYTGYQALFGAKYIAPEIGAGTDGATHNGYEVTNPAGNLVDLNGTQINGDFLSTPGFPGYSEINASQTLAYTADMLESGIPVVDAYISDIHGNEFINDPTVKAACAGVGNNALGSGSKCYMAQAAYYNAAFGTFFQRLAADGITPQNTLFVLSSDEGDHEAGANVGRAIQPTPATCDGTAANLCTYPAGTFGELLGNVPGLLNEETGDTTQFGMEFDTAPEYYVNGDPSESSAQVRTFDRDIASLTAFNPYAGATQKIANYLADPTEEAILHMVNADPARTPTLAEFAKPDYYLEQTSTSTCNDAVTGTSASAFPADCVTVSPSFAWDHGDYAAEINTNYVGFAGPGVKQLGLDGPTPSQGPSSAGANSGQTEVVDMNLPGPWTDETDIQPTEMYLLGLHTDYIQDGRVITQILANPNGALRNPLVTQLGEAYKQLNSSVGQFGAYTLTASTNAIESNTPGDAEFTNVNKALTALDQQRDALANAIKTELFNAENHGTPVPLAGAQLVLAKLLITAAGILAAHS